MSQSSTGAWRGARGFLLGLIAILLIPGPALLGHTSADGLVFGQYTARFAMILVLYILALGGLAALAVRNPGWFGRLLLRSIRWMQRYPALWLLAFYLMIEALYGVRGVLRDSSFFLSNDYFTVLGLIGNTELTPVMVSLALLEGFVLAFIIFAGREAADLKIIVFKAVSVILGAGFAVVILSLAWAYVLSPADYVTGHHWWWEIVGPDAELGYRLRPNAHSQVYVAGADRMVNITSNQTGFRDPGDVIGAPLAMIGDSFIFGQPLDDSEIWPGPLAAQLGVEVANYGIPGFDFWQYNRVNDLIVGQTDSRLVLYAIYANDLRDRSTTEIYPPLARQGLINRYRTPFHLLAFDLLSESPTRQIVSAIRRALASPPTEGASQQAAGGGCDLSNPPDGYPADYLREKVEDASRISAKNGQALAFVLIPTREAVYPESAAHCGPEMESALRVEHEGYTFICAVAEENGIPCLDMTTDFRQEAKHSAQPLYLSYDSHWSVEGQRYFADVVAGFVKENDLLAK